MEQLTFTPVEMKIIERFQQLQQKLEDDQARMTNQEYKELDIMEGVVARIVGKKVADIPWN